MVSSLKDPEVDAVWLLPLTPGVSLKKESGGIVSAS